MMASSPHHRSLAFYRGSRLRPEGRWNIRAPRNRAGLGILLGICSLSLLACGGGNVGQTNDGFQRTTTSSGSGGASASGNSASSSSSGPSSANATSTGAGGMGGAGGNDYVPEAIPNISDEVTAPCNVNKPGYFQFLDDLCKTKVLPTKVDRDLACPTWDDSATVALAGGGSVTYQPASSAPSVDTSALQGIVPPELMATVILIRRVNGVPHYRYLSTGDHDVPYQPWSTTKWLAAANAAATMRIQSQYKLGLDATAGNHLVGDLITSVHNYDDAPFSSNSLGRYFHNIGGRQRADDLIHTLWLKRPAAESFGGNYGAAAPSLPYTFNLGGEQLTITPDLSGGYANKLSSFTMAEALKRLVLHREEASQRLPGLQWADAKTLLYGAKNSSKYGPWGGMSQDTTIYLQEGHDIEYIERRSNGKWRVFSKLGLGTQGQFLNVGYACMPVLDDQNQPVTGWGREMVIATHLPSGGSNWVERDRLLAKAHRAIVKRVVDGRL